MPPAERTTEPPPDNRDRFEQLTGESLRQCPACRHGRMLCVETFEPGAQHPGARGHPVTSGVSAQPPPASGPPPRAQARPASLRSQPGPCLSSDAAASRSSPSTVRTILRRPLQAPRKAALPLRGACPGQGIPTACQRLSPSGFSLTGAAIRFPLALRKVVFSAADQETLFDIRRNPDSIS